MAKRKNKKNRMVIENLEQRLLLAGDDALSNVANTTDPWTFGTATTVLNMSGHYEIANVTTEASLNRILTVEMNNAGGEAGTASGWDLLRVNKVNITAKNAGSYSVSNGSLVHDAAGRYTIRLKSIGTLNTEGTQANPQTFDPMKSYRWKVLEMNSATATDVIQINGQNVSATNKFDASVFVVDTADFKINGTHSNRNVTGDLEDEDDGGLDILFGGRFTVELGEDNRSLYVNYISPIQPESTEVLAVSAGDELLWNINDVNNNRQTLTDGSSGELNRVAYNSFFSTEYEQFGHDQYAGINFSGISTATAENPYTIRTRTLASSKNALTLYGAGSFGALHNFDFSQPHSWKIAGTVSNLTVRSANNTSADANVNMTNELNSLISEGKIVLDTSNFIGVNMGTLSDELSLAVQDGSLVLKYTPKFSVTSEANFRTSSTVNLATKTGDVIELDLTQFFAQGATGFTVVTSTDVTGSNNLYSKSGEFKLIQSGTNLYFAPYITEEIATSLQQQTDRGFFGITEFKVRATEGTTPVEKVIKVRVDPGFGRLYLESSIGHNGANKTGDTIKVKQRLKFLGMPVSNAAFNQTSTGINGPTLNHNKHALTDYTSISVDGVNPGNYDVDSKFYQALCMFNAIVQAHHDSISDPSYSIPDSTQGVYTYDDYNFGGSFQNYVIKKIDPNNVSDKLYQWLSSTNAPFWMEVVDPDLNISGERGEFYYSTMGSTYGGPDTMQSERFGTNWIANAIYSSTKQLDGIMRVTGLSLINGGDSSFHKNHESGLSIDISTGDTVEDEKKTRILDAFGAFSGKIGHKLLAGDNYIQNSAYSSIHRFNDKNDHFHVDITIPIINDMFWRLEEKAFYELKSFQSEYIIHRKTNYKKLQGADSYRLHSINGKVLTQAQQTSFSANNELAFAGGTLKVISQADFQSTGRFYFSNLENSASNVEIVFEVTDIDPHLTSTNAQAKNFKYLTTVVLERNAKAPVSMPQPSKSVGATVPSNDPENEDVDVILTKARLNYLGFRDNQNNELVLNATEDASFIEAIKNFQKVFLKNPQTSPDGNITKTKGVWGGSGKMLWDLNSPRIIEVDGITAANGNVTSNYVKGFVDSVDQTSWNVVGYSTTSFLEETSELNAAINGKCTFKVSANSGQLANAVNAYFTADAQTAATHAGSAVTIRKVYVNSSVTAASITSNASLKAKIVQSADVAVGEFIVDLTVSNLNIAPTYEVTVAAEGVMQLLENEMPYFMEDLPGTGVLPQIGGGPTNWFDTLWYYENPTPLDPGLFKTFSTSADGSEEFSVSNIFDFSSSLSSYLTQAKELGGATYEGMANAIKERLDSVLSIFENSGAMVDVFFDNTTQELVFDIDIDVLKSVSTNFDFGLLSDSFKGSKIPIGLDINFAAHFSFGLQLADLLNGNSDSISLDDTFLRIEKLGIFGSISYGGDGYENQTTDDTQSGGLNIGSISLHSKLDTLSLEIGTQWNIRDESGATTVSFQDIVNKTVNWYNDSTAKLNGALLLTMDGDNVSGSATLSLTDDDLFESGNTNFTIDGQITVDSLNIGDGLLALGTTKLSFNSATKTITLESASAKLKVGDDLLTIDLEDSDDADSYAAIGTYNYDTGDFNLNLDLWDLNVKGVVSASGQGLVFSFSENSEVSGREIVGFENIDDLTIVPLNKTLDFAGVDTTVNGQTVKRALSIRDNGFQFAQVSMALTESLEIGSGLLSISNPTLIFENIIYTKDAAGVTGKIKIDTTAASVDMGGAIKLNIVDGSDTNTVALSGSYDLASKKFELNADTTTLDVGNGIITSTIQGLVVSHFFGDDGADPNEEVLSVSGNIDLTVKLSDTLSKTVTVAAQQMVVNGQNKTRSLSLTGNTFALGNASLILTDSINIGSFSIANPKLVLQNFMYNRATDEYAGKLGLAAESAGFSGNSYVDLTISKTTGDAIEVLYDLKEGGVTGTIDRVDFSVKGSDGKAVFLANASNIVFTVKDGNTSLDMSNVNATFPDLSLPIQSLGKVRISDGTVVVTHKGVDYDLSDGDDVVELLKVLGEGLLGGDDDVILTQDSVSKILTLKDRSSGTVRETYDLASIGDILTIDMGIGVDRVSIDSNIDMGGKDLSIVSEYITVSNKEIKNVDELIFNADSQFDISAIDMIGLLMEAFKVDLNGTSTTVDINYDSLINRLLGRAEAVVGVSGSNISARKVSFTANVNVFGERTGLLPVDFENEGGDATKFKLPGLTTALASVQAKALVNVLNSVITTGEDFLISSNTTINVKNTAVAEAQEDGEENDDDSTSYDAVVALAIVNSRSIASVSGTSQLNITGNITINASNNTTVENTATGLPAGSGKAYGGSVGILYLNKETEATIGSDVSFTRNPASVELTADSVSTVTNNVTAASGGAKKNNDNNQKTMQDNGGETGSGKVNVAGAAAITIVNDATRATANLKTVQTTTGDLAVNANSKNTITTKADGSTVSDSDSDSKVGVGVAVALNVVNADSTASVANISAGSVTVGAVNDTTVSAESIAGAGGNNVGIAGSVAVNTIDQNTSASGTSSINVSGGELSFKSESKLNATAKALPKDTGATGEKVGIGASFALNDLNVDTVATDKGSTITGNVSALKIDADSAITAHSETKAGSSATGGSGVAISPSVAVTVVQSDTKADHNAVSTPSITGDVAVTSDSSVTAVTKAGASADGKVAIGASIGVAVIKANNEAELGSSVTSGGKVDVTATNKMNSLVDVEATPRSGDGDKDKKSDEEANKQLSITRLSPTDKQSANADSTTSNQNSAASSEGGSNSNRVGVSAAVGVNVVTSHNRAEVVNDADITASGDVSIMAKEDVDVVTQAVALSFNKETDSGAKFGAGVGLNVVNKTNTASVSGDIIGNNVVVSAETVDSNKSAVLAVAAAAGMGDGVSVSVTAGVNVVNSTTSATVDSQSQIESSGNSTVSAKNDTNIQTLVLAAGVSQNSAGIGAAVAVNVLNSDVNANIAGDADATGNVTVSAVNNVASQGHKFKVFSEPVMGQQNVDIELSGMTAVAAAGGASQGSAGVAGSFIINAYDLNTEAVIDKGAVISSDGDVAVSSVSNTDLKNITGTIGASAGSAGVGAGCEVTILNKNTSAVIRNSSTGTGTDLSAGGNVSVTADSDESMLSVVAGLAAADSVAVGVSASVLVVNTTTEAVVEDVTQTGESIRINSKDLSLKASDNFDLTQIVAGVSASGSAAVGGGAAVLVHNDDVKARIGDNTTARATGSVLVDAESSEKMVQVVANIAASGSAAVSGAALVTNLDENTEASIGKSSVDANGAVTVAASDETGQIGVVGTVAASGGAGVGLGGNVVVMNKNTTAQIDSGAVLRSRASNIIIAADSAEKEIAITAGVAAGNVGVGLNASVTTANVTTNAIIGNGARVLANDTVSVSAHDDLDIDKVTAGVAAGSAGVGMAASVTVINQNTNAIIDDSAVVTGLGIGAGVAVNHGRFGTLNTTPASSATDGSTTTPLSVEGYKDTKSAIDFDTMAGTAEVAPVSVDKDNESAAASDHDEAVAGVATKNTGRTVKGVAVTSSNNTDIVDVAAGIGAGAVGVSLNAGVMVIDNSSQAVIDNGAQINTLNKSSAASDQAVTIAAGNNLNYTAVTASIAGGAVGIAPAANVAIAKLTTRADVNNNAVVEARTGGVQIAAESNERLLGVSFGGAGGVVGIGGSVQVIRVDNNTGASIGNGARITTTGDLSITAIDSVKTTTFSGGVAGGLVGIGATVGVLTVYKNTSVVIDGDINARDVNALAQNNDFLFQIAIAGGAGLVGVGGAISIMIYDADTNMEIGINADIDATGTISIKSHSISRVKSFTLGVAGGYVGVGGAVSVGKIANNTNVTIEGNLTADEDINITADSNVDLKALTIAGAGGAVAVSAGVASWSIGGSAGTSANGKDALEDPDYPDAERPDDDANNKASQSTSQTVELLNKKQNSSSNVAPKSTNDQDRDNISAATGKVSSSNTSRTPQTTSGTNVNILSTADITAGQDINVTADGDVDVEEMTPSITGGAIAVGGAINILNIDTDVKANVGGVLRSGEDTIIVSRLNENVEMTAIGGEGGLVAVGAAVIVANDDSSVRTTILATGSNPRNTSISGRNVSISSIRNIESFEAEIIKPAVGAIVVGGSFIKTDIADAGAETRIGSGARVSATQDLVVYSDAEETVTNHIVPVAIGVGAFNGVKSEINVVNSAKVNVESLTTLTGDTVIINAYGDHTDRASINSLGIGGVNAGVFLSKITNTSDANVVMGATSITGSTIKIGTSNNFDRKSYNKTVRPEHTTINGDSFSAVGVDVHKSEVSLGTGSSNRFSSDVTITGNAKINAVKSVISSGSPKVSILAQTNIYLYEKSHAESASLLGNVASVTSNVNLWTSSTINITKDAISGKAAEINNTSGQVSFATLTNAMVYNIAESHTKAILLTVSHAAAKTVMNVNNLITLQDANVKANEVYIASGRVLGSSESLSGYVNMIQSNNFAQGFATGTVGIPTVKSENSSTVTNGINITGLSEVKSFGNVTLSAEAGKNLFWSEYEVWSGNVTIIPISDFEGEFKVLTPQTSITIGSQAKVSAGVDNDQTALFLTNAQAQQAGLGTSDISELTAAQIANINALGLVTLNTNVPMSAVHLSCDIDVPIGVGSVVHHNGNYYKYQGILLGSCDFSDTSTWEVQDSDFIPPYFFYDAGTVTTKVALQINDYVRSNGSYYRYKKSRDLTTENYASSQWSVTADSADIAVAMESNIANEIKNTLKSSIILIKPKDMEMPQLSYVNYKNLLERRLRELDGWIVDHRNDSSALARYEAVRQMLNNQLAELPYEETRVLGHDGTYVTLRKQITNSLIASFEDIHASRGSVIVNLDGSDASVKSAVTAKRLTAGAGAAVTIRNGTPVSLDINNITMKSNSNLTIDPNNGDAVLLEGGGIYLNTVNIGSAGAASGGTVDIIQDAVSANLSFGGVSQPLLTDIFVRGTILNEAGKVTIINREGSINITGEIIAQEQEISSKTSVNINAPGFYTIGANPKVLTEDLWVDLARDGSKIDGFPGQSTTSDDDSNEGEKYTRYGGTVRAMGNITIIANHINVNGTVESGISDLKLTVARNTIYGIPYGNPVVVTQVNGGTITRVGAEVQYSVDNYKKSVEIDDIVTRSGNIILCGDLFNTNASGSNIKIAHGYANIQMVNTTEYSLIVNKIDTSRKNTGSVTLYDTMRDKRTIYRHDNGQITRDVYDVVYDTADQLYKYVKNDSESSTIEGNKTTYRPLDNLFLIWVEGQGAVETTTERWEKKSFNLTPGWTSWGDSLNDSIKKDGHLVSSETVKVGNVELKKSLSLHHLQPGDTDFNYLRSKGVFDESNQLAHKYYGEFSSVPEGEPQVYIAPPEHHGGGWMQEETWVTQIQTIKGSTEYYSHYLYGSNDINVDFSGGHSASDIKIESKGNVLLQGNVITPENSTMLVKSEGEVSIAENVIFSGVTPVIENVNRDITLNVVITDKPLNVSANGNITINAVAANGSTAPLIIGAVKSASGTVRINSATGVVAQDANSIVRGEKVYIHAANGTIGEETLALRVDSNILGKNAGGVTAYAKSNIYMTETDGAMRLIKYDPSWNGAQAAVHSINGNVTLATVSGSIINGFTGSQTASHVQGKKISLTSGGSGEVKDLQVGDHDSLYVNSASNVNLSSRGEFKIGSIASGEQVTLTADGDIIDLGTETSAVLAAKGLTIDSKKAVRGTTAGSAFDIQLGTGSELTIDSGLDSWVNQVAQNGVLRGTVIITDGLNVKSANSSGNINVSTEEGDLLVTRATGKNITLNAAGSILDATPDTTGIVANAETIGAVAGEGNVLLSAGGNIGQYDNFFDVKAIGNVTAVAAGNGYVQGIGSLSVMSAVSTGGDFVLRTTGDATIYSMTAVNGTVAVDANGSILNSRSDSGDAVSALTIVLNAQYGTIGSASRSFAVDSTNGTVTAEAAGTVYMTENQGVMNINSIKSFNSEVILSARDGMADANSAFNLGLDHFGLADLHVNEPVTDLNVAATTIRLVSSQGGIGALTDAIEIDVYGERTGRIFADAREDISIEEIVGSMNVGTVLSSDGTIALSTRDTASAGENIYLDAQSTVRALKGDVHLRSGDSLYHLSGAVIIAGKTIFIYGDFGNADPGIGSEIVIKGTIAAGLIRITGEDDNDTILLDVRDNDTVSGRVEVFGGKGDDTITALKLDTDQIHLYGEDDNDTILADSMTNRIHAYGGAGNDLIRGGQDGDIIFGGDGDDDITGAGGTDFIFGDGGQMIDDLLLAASDKDGTGKDTIDGGVGADVIIGDNGRIIVSGLYTGENTVKNLLNISNTQAPLGDNDSITAGSGDDYVLGGLGSDLLDGGDHDDTILGDTGSISFESVDGISHISIIDSTNQIAGGDDIIIGSTGVERIVGGAGKDDINTGSDNGSDVVLGDTGRVEFDIVEGRSVVSRINTVGEIAGSDDRIYTGSGSDVVVGGEGADLINAGEGSNSIVIGDNGEVAFENPDLDNHLVDHVTATDIGIGGNDTILTGSAADIVLGGMGSDEIRTGLGEDIILGDNGTVQYSKGLLDIIYTSDNFAGGNDLIVCGNDNKIILGGYGDDSITSLNGDDVIFGDGGYVDFDRGVITEANGNGVKYGGNDKIDAGVGLNSVIGGLGDDVITTGIDRTLDTADIRDIYSNENDVVIGDNGRRTFNGTGVQVDELAGATLSFNFQGQASKGIDAGKLAGAPESKVANWNNIQSYGPGTFGNDPKEIIFTDKGQRMEGLNLSWGGKEKHRTDSIELHNYQMENYNPEAIIDPLTGQLSSGDGYLFAGGIRTSAPNTQRENKLELEMDGLNKYFKEYSVIVYLDAPNSVSSLIQNPWDSTLGSQLGRGESIRKISIDSADKKDSFFIDDAADANNPAYNTFNGNYIKATAKDALSAFGKYANYVVFEGLTDDRFVITITDGVLNINFNGRDLPSIAGIQIVGTFHPVDNIESSPSETGGNDTISTSGGDDIVIGGVGSDSIATFGDIRDGIDDADTVIGDNGSATVMYRSGWLSQNEAGEWIATDLSPEIVNARSADMFPEISIPEIEFNDLIFTGNGNDVVIGGEGQDRVNTQRQDEIASDIWKENSAAPEAMRQENLASLQNLETQDVTVLSLNFSYSYNDPSKNDSDLKVDPNEYAGVVAARNWNNVNLQDQLSPLQYPNPYTNSQFFLDDGSVASGLNLNMQTREFWGGNPVSIQADRSNGHDQIDPDSENSKLFESSLWAQKQQQIEININNIGDQTGFDVYDVYVYIDGDNERTEDDNYVYEVAGGDIYNNQMSAYYLNDWRGNTFNGEFKEVTATSYIPANNGIVPNMDMVGNYVVFRNVTAKDFAIRIKNVSVGDQFPLNMPSIAGVQIVSGAGRSKVALNSESGNVARNGDYDKDVVLGDNGKVNYTIAVPYGTNDNLAIAQNKAYEVVSDDRIYAGRAKSSQSDFIVTGRNQDLVIGGNGSDAIDSGSGHDVVIGDNAKIQMVDYNPIGLRMPANLKILDATSFDSEAYMGKPGTSADQIKAKIDSGLVKGIKMVSSEQGGSDVVDGGRDNDLLLGQESNDVLIGNEGDDVIYDKVGSNKVKDKAYTSPADYRADVGDVISQLDENGVKVMEEFIGNDFGKTTMTGAITQGLGSGTSDPGSGSSITCDLSNLQDAVLTLQAGDTVTLTSSNWPGKDNPYWNPNIALEFNGNGTPIPNLELTWIVSGNTQKATIAAGSWYTRVNEIPDSPNSIGVYSITLKALTAGSFRVKLTA